MLHLIMFSTLFGSSIALPRPPAGVIANLVGDVAQAVPKGAVANVIPEEIIIGKISPFMGFDEAMTTKDAFGWTDDQLVLQFSRLEPERVKSFIFRELDNPEIDDATRLTQLEILLDENPELRIPPLDMHRVGQTGHEELVARLIAREPDLGLVAARASISRDQLHVFEIAIGLETSPGTMRIMLRFAAQHSVPFVRSGLDKVSLSPQMSQMFPITWFNDLVMETIPQIHLGNTRSPEILEYLLTRPEWNPGFEILLRMMLLSLRNDDVTTRLGQEFLNPRLTFQATDGAQISGGVDALDAAIRLSELVGGFNGFRLQQTLRLIRGYIFEW